MGCAHMIEFRHILDWPCHPIGRDSRPIGWRLAKGRWPSNPFAKGEQKEIHDASISERFPLCNGGQGEGNGRKPQKQTNILPCESNRRKDLDSPICSEPSHHIDKQNHLHHIQKSDGSSPRVALHSLNERMLIALFCDRLGAIK